MRRLIKRYLPATLFGRALLILALPVVLTQLAAIYVFYERHWDSIVRNMSSALAGEVALLVNEFERSSKSDRVRHTAEIGDYMGIAVLFDDRKEQVFVEGVGEAQHQEFFHHLKRKLNQPFMVQQEGEERDMLISILMDDGTLQLRTTKKRLVSPTTYIFIFWMAGSASLFMVIAILFLRNQIRPIRQLAVAAERFGMGQDTPNFAPRGAAEVRQAGRAFLVMRDRIQRQITTRTEMLAGISHDLRTPLTRIKLQAAMLNLPDKARTELDSDVEEMEHMIQEYLDFARGEGREQAELISLNSWIESVIENYQRHNQPVQLSPLDDVALTLRPQAMRRALQNVIDNALRYGKAAYVTVVQKPRQIQILVDDDGPGIPVAEQETVFRPFTRLEASRNVQTGGAGLGLSIARDAVQAHGGTIELENRATAGLRVVITLPRDTSDALS